MHLKKINGKITVGIWKSTDYVIGKNQNVIYAMTMFLKIFTFNPMM